MRPPMRLSVAQASQELSSRAGRRKSRRNMAMPMPRITRTSKTSFVSW